MFDILPNLVYKPKKALKMSGNTPSPTPSQDNMYNSHNVNITAALDQVMSAQPQSYDDFLNGFTYLTKDDVKQQVKIDEGKTCGYLDTNETKAKTTNKSRSKDRDKHQGTITPITKGETTPSDCVTTHVSTSNHKGSNDSPHEEDDLEEEILTEGTKTSIMTKETGNTVTGRLQFDNFVDTSADSDDSKTEESDDVGGYIASFSNVGSNDKATPPGKEKMDSNIEMNPNDSDEEVLTRGNNCLNPGEVEDIDDTPCVQGVQKNTNLDFSAKFRTVEDVIIPTSDEVHVCSDEVEPFALDENFDYDNVILTPKYSLEDLQLMKTLREQNQQDSG